MKEEILKIIDGFIKQKESFREKSMSFYAPAQLEVLKELREKVCQLEPPVSDDLGRKFIEKAYLYRCNYIRDTDNWEGDYSYLMADSLEEAYELAKILYDKENKCIIDIRYIECKKKDDIYLAKILYDKENKCIDIRYIECKKKDDIYGCYMLAPNSR